MAVAMTPEERDEAEQVANRFMDLHEDLMFIFKHNMVRSTSRINSIIRYAMVGMVVMMLAMLALVATFTTRMDSITSYMVEMADDMQRMREDFDNVNAIMRSMEQSVVAMDGYVAPMPSIFSSVDAMSVNMSRMREYLGSVEGDMDRIQVRMVSLGGALQAMDQKMIDMSGAIGGIGRDVNIMSRPMSILPNN
ncbi:hypothetical protein [Lamprobacter modestohalophilus]|nr:hypothetical protein [Lamprobacter modestohalophilus]MCF7994501.1 hypothetical protein [Chromatiaceae bacterium]